MLGLETGNIDPATSPNVDGPASDTRFMDYYQRNLAGLMVWLDSEENDYRKRVVPLAEHQPAIGFAIVAFAAQHGAMTCNPHENIATIAQSARDRCLQLIQTRAQEMTEKLAQGFELSSESDIADAEWMLASILIVNNYENARCRVDAAESHRRAARTIVNLFSQSVSVTAGHELFAFLRNQLAIEDVMAATTTFDEYLIRNAITPVPGSDSLLFSKYLTLLHQITLQSVERIGRLHPAESSEEPLTMSMVQSEFEQARGATLIAAGRLGLGGSTMVRDFVRLVEVYHNAGLLYAFSCLEYAREKGPEWRTICTKLFDQLSGFEDLNSFVQNLAWPTFIAGTTCHGNKERQGMVVWMLTAIHEVTRFDYYMDAVDFLKCFWADSNVDWRARVRAREASGKRMFVV
ncbi:hypothetical protein Daus18300_003315 [Diaporthe australafricana]|uniref:Uncharacterized protein n=1 Tax=Diaporthe australafricana TaxID=127596 RepID=A0ABR3XH03_9PEZI